MKHSDLVRTLIKPGITIQKELTPDDIHKIHMSLGIAGEAGELVDAIKKVVIYRKPIDIDNVIEELGDLEFYMEGLRQSLGITREETLTMNIIKLSTRYKDVKYTDEQAIARKDKD